MLTELDTSGRHRLEWLIARQDITLGSTSSWDLLTFDGDGRVLSVDYFHLDGHFPTTGAAWVEQFAIRHDLMLLGTWYEDPHTGAWAIRISTTGEVLPLPRFNPWPAHRRTTG